MGTWFQNASRDLTRWLDAELFSIHEVQITPVAVLIFVLTLLVSVLLGRIAARGVARMTRRGGDRGASEGAVYALSRITQYVITVLGVLVGLENIGISLGTLAAFGAVFAVGLGFGLQTIAQNFVSGLILLFERPIAKGDVVIVDGIYGIVDEIAIRATRVMTFDEIALIVPNSKFVSEIVENRSEPTRQYRKRIDIRVAYGSDTRQVERTLLELAGQHPKVLKDPPPLVFFTEFGESSLDFQLCVWLNDPLAALGVSSDLRHATVKAFRANNIRIPFPQRDVRVVQTPETDPGAYSPV